MKYGEKYYCLQLAMTQTTLETVIIIGKGQLVVEICPSSSYCRSCILFKHIVPIQVSVVNFITS